MPKFKSKQPAWFFLLGITTHLVVKHGPLNILLCPALCSLGIKGVRDGERQVFIPTHPLPRAERTGSPLAQAHIDQRSHVSTALFLWCWHIVIKSDSVSDYFTYEAMLKDLKQLKLLFKDQFYKDLCHGTELWESAAKQSNICSLKSLPPNQTWPKKHFPDPLTLLVFPN